MALLTAELIQITMISVHASQVGPEEELLQFVYIKLKTLPKTAEKAPLFVEYSVGVESELFTLIYRSFY